jgi:hypothetical protein
VNVGDGGDKFGFGLGWLFPFSVAGHFCNAVTNATPDRFRLSGPQKMARASSSLHKASSKNG